MNYPASIPALERPAFFDGQRLTAADLAAVQAYHRELRWLHNRGLHEWGIVFGYEVTGERGGDTVRVGNGFAVTVGGRELVLTAPLELQIPAAAGAPGGGPATYRLTVSYADEDEPAAETRAGACGASGVVRRLELPQLRWLDATDTTPDRRYREGEDLVLATILVLDCRLAESPSGVERREVGSRRAPYVGAGKTVAGKTSWRLWPSERRPVGVATNVSTARAGFSTTPVYQAQVAGERVFSVTPENTSFDAVVDGYAFVAEPTPTSFELRLVLPTGDLDTAAEAGTSAGLNPTAVLTAAFMQELEVTLRWHVVWMGVES